MLFQRLGQIQRILPRGQRAFGDFELPIQLAKLEVGTRHVGDQSGNHCALRPLIRKQSGARGFRCAAIAAPEVHIPRSACRNFSECNFIRGDRTDCGVAHATDVAAASQRGELVGASDAQLRLRLQNTGGRDAHVVIIFQRGTNQALKFLVLENFPPLLVSDRSNCRGICVCRGCCCGRWSRCRRRRLRLWQRWVGLAGAPVSSGDIHSWTLVVRANGTRRHENDSSGRRNFREQV